MRILLISLAIIGFVILAFFALAGNPRPSDERTAIPYWDDEAERTSGGNTTTDTEI